MQVTPISITWFWLFLHSECSLLGSAWGTFLQVDLITDQFAPSLDQNTRILISDKLSLLGISCYPSLDHPSVKLGLDWLHRLLSDQFWVELLEQHGIFINYRLSVQGTNTSFFVIFIMIGPPSSIFIFCQNVLNISEWNISRFNTTRTRGNQKIANTLTSSIWSLTSRNN